MSSRKSNGGFSTHSSGPSRNSSANNEKRKPRKHDLQSQMIPPSTQIPINFIHSPNNLRFTQRNAVNDKKMRDVARNIYFNGYFNMKRGNPTSQKKTQTMQTHSAPLCDQKNHQDYQQITKIHYPSYPYFLNARLIQCISVSQGLELALNKFPRLDGRRNSTTWG
jgi:hypothetical protein